MPSLLLTIFLLQLTIHIINSVGASTINDLLWLLYSKLPTSTSHTVQKQITLRREVVRIKRELAGVSPQDDFARWAKLDRQHNRTKAEYDKISSTLSSTQSTFQSRTTTLRYIATNGLRFFLQFWYAKRALFYIPKGWAPWYAEWMLSFPRAPRGSVSVQVWGIACASVIALVGEAVIAGFVLWASSRAGNGKVGEKGKMEKGEMKFKA